MEDTPKPEGDNVIDMPTEAEVQEMQIKLAEAMKDEELQNFAASIVLGNQLYAWGVMFMTRNPSHEPQVLQTMVDAIQQSMIDPTTGIPRPFSEEAMLANLEELLPFMREQVKVHGTQREAINKVTEDMIKEAASKAGEPKEKQEENEGE
jgi:hypothetical protein